MPCAEDALCTIPGLTLEPPNDHACHGGRGGRLHGLCGDGGGHRRRSTAVKSVVFNHVEKTHILSPAVM